MKAKTATKAPRPRSLKRVVGRRRTRQRCFYCKRLARGGNKQCLSNGYVDEWHSIEPCGEKPFSLWVAETIGTNDMACVLGLIRAAREVEANGSHRTLKALREALAPFATARCVEPSNAPHERPRAHDARFEN